MKSRYKQEETKLCRYLETLLFYLFLEYLKALGEVC